MPKQLEVLNLSFYSSSHIPCDKLPSRDYFKSNFLATDLVHSQLDLSKRTLSKRFYYCILAKPLARPLHGGSRLWTPFLRVWWISAIPRFRRPCRGATRVRGDGYGKIFIIYSGSHNKCRGSECPEFLAGENTRKEVQNE